MPKFDKRSGYMNWCRQYMRGHPTSCRLSCSCRHRWVQTSPSLPLLSKPSARQPASAWKLYLPRPFLRPALSWVPWAASSCHLIGHEECQTTFKRICKTELTFASRHFDRLLDEQKPFSLRLVRLGWCAKRDSFQRRWRHAFPNAQLSGFVNKLSARASFAHNFYDFVFVWLHMMTTANNQQIRSIRDCQYWIYLDISM